MPPIKEGEKLKKKANNVQHCRVCVLFFFFFFFFQRRWIWWSK